MFPEPACQPKLTRSRFMNPDRTIQGRLPKRLPRRAEHRLGLIEAIRHPAARAMRSQARMRSTTSLFNDSGHLIDVIDALLTTQVVICAKPMSRAHPLGGHLWPLELSHGQDAERTPRLIPARSQLLDDRDPFPAVAIGGVDARGCQSRLRCAWGMARSVLAERQRNMQ